MDIKKTVATEEKEKYYEIVVGPSKDLLFDACKYAYSKNANISVSFSIAAGYTMPANDPTAGCIPMRIKNIRICSIEHEDGSGESFNLHGYCMADLNSFHANVNYESYRFKAYYNTKNRRGCITFTKW